MRIFFIEWNADYGKLMIDNLASYYDVHRISRVLRHFKSIHKILPTKYLKKNHIKLHARVKFRDIHKDDLIICNGYSVLSILDLISTLPAKKIVILRDTIEKLNKNMRHKNLLSTKENYLEKLTPLVDKIYSFDECDCKRYNIAYLPPFLSFTHQQFETKKQHIKDNPSCFYVGAKDEYREKIITSIHQTLIHHGCITDFFLIDKDDTDARSAIFKNEKLTYQQNLDKIKNSDILIEINIPTQVGLTLRALESIFFNKKLITTNCEIKNYDFYDPQRVFIWGHDPLTSLPDFLQKPSKAVSNEIIKNYSADAMLERLLTDNYFSADIQS